MVIVIIAILSTLLMVAIFKIGEGVDMATTKNTLMTLRNGIMSYKSVNGVFPTADQVSDGSFTAKEGMWIYDLQYNGQEKNSIQDPGDEIEAYHQAVDGGNEAETGAAFDAWGQKISFRIVGANTSPNSALPLNEYKLVSNLLNTFYVWSNGSDGTNDFVDEFDDTSTHGTEWQFAVNGDGWKTYEHKDDLYWDDFIDDVVVSGHK